MAPARNPCPSGKIMRRGYKIKSTGTYVKPACTKDMGRPGKGKPVWKVSPGGLDPYKVVNPRTRKLYSPATRHDRLRKAYRKISAKGNYSKKGILVARLNALRNYYANAQTARGKQLHAAMSSDLAWAQRNLS